jgi:hypothetical protein
MFYVIELLQIGNQEKYLTIAFTFLYFMGWTYRIFMYSTASFCALSVYSNSQHLAVANKHQARRKYKKYIRAVQGLALQLDCCVHLWKCSVQVCGGWGGVRANVVVLWWICAQEA